MEGILPEEIRWRKDKLGFATPESVWIARLAPFLQDYLTTDLYPFINIDHLRAALVKLKNDMSEKNTAVLWRYIVFAVWNKVFKSWLKGSGTA
jgi:asparagine synthase (glutamine-hydrolysing)